MSSARSNSQSSAAWTVMLGPGPRFEGLEPLLLALGAAGSKESARAIEVVHLADLEGLLAGVADAGRLILDCDHVSSEDTGFVRRFLSSQPAWSLLLIGEDAGRKAARALLAMPRTKWLAWPPDLEQLRELVRVSSAPVERQVADASAAPLRAVEMIPAAAPASSNLPSAKDQVALLSDIAQRLESSFGLLRESGRVPEGELEGFGSELRKLLRFTRSLAYLASVPPRGQDEFDVGALVEEQLAALTLRGRKGPRFLPRGPQGNPELPVRGDKAALALSIEALFSLARACSAAGEIIRIPYGPSSEREISIAVEFPEGPLTGLPLASILQPYALRERLPDFGPNDLAAALAIVRAHGGELTFGTGAVGNLLAQIRLPAARPSASHAVRAPAALAENDPFA